MTFKPYTDPTNGQWVGEHETRTVDGDVSRRTEWFTTEQEARQFARTGRALSPDWARAFVARVAKFDRLAERHAEGTSKEDAAEEAALTLEVLIRDARIALDMPVTK